MNIDLSICILGIPERIDKAKTLIEKLDSISGENVEILYFLDRKQKTIGQKRQALVAFSSGKYICFIDDDDDVSIGFIEEVVKATKKDKDIITFNQLATLVYTSQTAEINKIEEYHTYKVNFSIHNENEDLHKGIVKRKPFHMCPVKREIVEQVKFPEEKVYDEDWVYMSQALELIKTEYHIDKILHFYQFSETLTATQ